MTNTQHTKQFCLNGGVVSAALDDENEVRYLFSDDELDEEDRLLISLELQALINQASFIPADPHAYIKYIATKCGCCDDILLLKHETLVIA